MKINFAIKLSCQKGRHSDYAYSEIDHMIECADGLDQPLRDNYVEFLKALLGGMVKPLTLIDVDVIRTFQEDLDNRAQIDFREDHDHEPSIVAGGKYFESLSDDLYLHIKQCGWERSR